MRKALGALALVALVAASCNWKPSYGAPKERPKPEPSAVAPMLFQVEQLAKDLAFFEAQGDSGLAVEVARHFDAATGCTSGYTLAYWQEEQRAEEILARVAATKELSLTYQYVAGALADALLPLPYTAQDGTEQEADFIGVLAAVNCPGGN